jgi:hypothetical protein
MYREGRAALSQHYRQGRQVHWSGFSSASPSRKVALNFAGAGGVLLRLVLLNEDSRSRDIHHLSAISAENEVLLHTANSFQNGRSRIGMCTMTLFVFFRNSQLLSVIVN